MPNEMRSEFMKNAMPEPILLKHNNNVPIITLIEAAGIIKMIGIILETILKESCAGRLAHRLPEDAA